MPQVAKAHLEAHVNYIHFNPVKHGLVKQVVDWPYSSFHRYIRGLIADKLGWGYKFMRLRSFLII
jgi:putative transposase